MFLKLLFIVATVIASIECKQSYIINGGGWKLELEKCGTGSEENRSNNFKIGTLDTLPGLEYDDIGKSIGVDARGFLELHTSTGTEVKELVHLTEYHVGEDFKQFSQGWTRATKSGLAKHTVAISLTVRIHRTGLIELITELYGHSHLAVTCATSKAFVDTIEIISY